MPVKPGIVIYCSRWREEVAELRPAVIDRESALTLDEFRRFRHLVRNVYAMNLSPAGQGGRVNVGPARIVA